MKFEEALGDGEYLGYGRRAGYSHNNFCDSIATSSKGYGYGANVFTDFPGTIGGGFGASFTGDGFIPLDLKNLAFSVGLHGFLVRVAYTDYPYYLIPL